MKRIRGLKAEDKNGRGKLWNTWGNYGIHEERSVLIVCIGNVIEFIFEAAVQYYNLNGFYSSLVLLALWVLLALAVGRNIKKGSSDK